MSVEVLFKHADVLRRSVDKLSPFADVETLARIALAEYFGHKHVRVAGR